MKGSGGNLPLFLGEVNQSIFFWGKGGSMHLTPPQAATVNLIQGSTGLLCAQTKCQNIHIINKTNAGDGEVKRIAEVNKVSIIKEKQDGRERRALGDARISRKQR